MIKKFLVLSSLAVLLYAPARAVDAGTEEFLDMVEKSAFMYFMNECGPNGLIQDRMTDKKMSSTLTEGFHLTAMCIGAERGWISREEAAVRTLITLESYSKLKRFHGIFAHYYDIHTGEVIPLMHKIDDGADLSETGFMMGGVLVCRTYFDRDNETERKIRALATQLYEAVEWDWMLQDQYGKIHKTLSWMWSPNYGFTQGQRIKSNMEMSSMITYLLAIGSPSHPIPADCWEQGWATNYRTGTFHGRTFIYCPPLFAHQYAQVWFDFRSMKDRFADYFRNSTHATLVNREYCLNTLYPGKDIWGLTFCDGPKGYGIYGYPPKNKGVDEDATIAPTGPGGSIVFTPEESISSLKYMYANYKDQLWDKYGFYDSFSLKHNWFDKDYIGLDQGPILIMIENYRTGLVWKYFMKNEYVRAALDKAGFRGVIDDFEDTQGLKPYAAWKTEGAGKDIVIAPAKDMVKDGKGSLKIKYSAVMPKEALISAAPAIVNFGGYKYLSLWLYGSEDLKVSLVKKDGAAVELAEARKVLCSDGWKHCYYSIPAGGADNISKIIFSIKGYDSFPFGEGLWPKKVFFLDEVLLSNILDDAPAQPGGFKASSAVTPGEAELSWNNVSGARHYIVRYSEKPVGNEKAFAAAKEALDPFAPVIYASGANINYTVSGLAPGRTYYFSVKAVSPSGETSNFSAVGPVKLAPGIPDNPVLEDFDGPASSVWSASSKALVLKTGNNGQARSGKGSLRVDYAKSGAEDSWAHLVMEPSYHDFSKHGSLTVWVYGKAEVLGKLWNNEDSQEDLSIQSAPLPDGWNKLVFDLKKTSKVDKQRVKKLLLFIQPGKTDISGTVYIDSVELSK